MGLRNLFQQMPPPDDDDTQSSAPPSAKTEVVEVLVSAPVGGLVIHPAHPDDILIVNGQLDGGYLVALTFHKGGVLQQQPHLVVIRPAREFVVIGNDD